jgi:hypothetical protein
LQTHPFHRKLPSNRLFVVFSARTRTNWGASKIFCFTNSML